MSKKITAEDVESLELELARAREQLAKQVREDRPAAMAQLAEIVKSLHKQIADAEQIAANAGLVFYYSNGYEQFNYVEKENWSYSSQDC